MPAGTGFFAHVKTGSEVHPASYAMGTGSFSGVKWPGRGVDHPTPSSAEVKERVELYFYSPSGPSRPVLGWPLPLPFYLSSVLFLFSFSFVSLLFMFCFCTLSFLLLYVSLLFLICVFFSVLFLFCCCSVSLFFCFDFVSLVLTRPYVLLSIVSRWMQLAPIKCHFITSQNTHNLSTHHREDLKSLTWINYFFSRFYSSFF